MEQPSTSVAGASGLAQRQARLAQRLPEQRIEIDGATMSYRRSGAGPSVVLLHGIGSGAASWLDCALLLASDHDVLAWNAPGYGASAALPAQAPDAAAYAARLRALLMALGIERCILVGHSLGALMAAALVAAAPELVARLVLISPAHGYGTPAAAARGAEVAQSRLEALARLGVAGVAAQRAAHMVSPQAGDDERDWVRWNMAQLNPAGYGQAVRLLCGDAIVRHNLGAVAGLVACGSADTVTTAAGSAALADTLGFGYVGIDGAGHACYVENPAAVAALIRSTNQAERP